MTISPATQHYRGMFERRSPEEIRTLAHIKRFMERLVGDANFRTALGENIDKPKQVADGYGIDIDPMDLQPAWSHVHLKYRRTPECARWPLVVAWDVYMAEMIRHRDLLRDEGNMATVHPRFHAWRERQIQRSSSELGGTAGSITHPVIAFELSEGCSVGCWFCGIAADRFKGHYGYRDDNVGMWRGVVGAAHELFGPAARTGFCYWATDPCDNPDYDRFLVDYYEITGALPQTTTAIPLKNIDLTRRILGLFDKHRTVTNRFSVLTAKQLDQIHAAFSAEELIGVELVLQNKEALTAKADAGRAHERREALRAANKNDQISLVEFDHTTIACVSGFLVNMMSGRIRLVTPVPGSARWPLGYRVVDERFFKSVGEFSTGIQGLIDGHMSGSLPLDRPVRFRRDLRYEPGDTRFMLRSRCGEHSIINRVGNRSLGELIARGDKTAPELLDCLSAGDENLLPAADLLDQLFAAGLLEEDFDDRFAGRRNEGLEMRAAAARQTIARMAASHVDSA